MSLFANGDFKIENSWGQKPASRESSKQKNRPPSANRPSSKDNKSFANVGQKIVGAVPDSLDTFVADKVYRDFQAEIPPPPGSARSVGKSRSKQNLPGVRLPPRQKTNADQDLVTSMASRLKQVEVTCSSLKSELKQKNTEIQKLKAENMFLKGFRENADQKYKQFLQMEDKNKQLQEKVKQMEEYLKKYGMKWVGNNAEGKLDKDKMKKDITNAKNNYRLPSEIDIGTIQRRVEELNGGLHAQGQGTQIYQQNGVHKFRKAEPLPIAFFAEGIAIKGMNFYPYKSKESLKILSDLVDGYFPYVLKAKYPNGVFLKVVDMIAVRYEDYQKQGGQNVGSFEGIGKNDFKPLSKDEFLNKLPKQIIQNGKVIPVRDEIGKMFEPEKKSETERDQSIKNAAEHYEQIEGCLVFKTKAHTKIQQSQDKSSEDFCTLKIRTESGKICILEFQKSERIREAYAWMRKIVTEKFKLVGNYPRRTYEEDEQEDLESLGFYPNAIMHVQIIK